MTPRETIVAEALSWQGTKHIHAARVKGAGIDCATFLMEVFERVGMIPHIEVEHYPHDWHLHQDTEIYLRHVEQYAHRIEGPPEPGDIVLYKWGRVVSHGAIVVQWPTIIHAYVNKGVVLDDGERNADLAKRQVGFWSLFGGADGR